MNSCIHESIVPDGICL